MLPLTFPQYILLPQAIPLPRQKVLLELVVGRLRDKSSNVRKNAVQLLSAFLTSNPFAGKVGEREGSMEESGEKGWDKLVDGR